MHDRMTSAEADVLYDARLLLERLSTEARDDVVSAARSVHDASDLGRFAEACTAAEDAVFRALNVAMSYLQDDAALASHARWMERLSTEEA